jgi:hypothetical protein
MRHVTPEEAQTHFAELIAAAIAGEEIIIVADHNKGRLHSLSCNLFRRKAEIARRFIKTAPDFEGYARCGICAIRMPFFGLLMLLLHLAGKRRHGLRMEHSQYI